MAKPAFIIFASQRIEDKETNAISLVNIIETAVFEVPPEMQRPPRSNDRMAFDGWIVAVWILEDGDAGTVFRRDFSLISPSGKQIHTQLEDFTVEAKPNAHFHRTAIHVHGFPILREHGLWHIEARIGRVDQPDQWAMQRFPVFFEIGEHLAELLKADTESQASTPGFQSTPHTPASSP